MPSVIQKKSYNSAQVFWLNKTLLEKKIFGAVRKLASNCLEVQKVVLFGSAAKTQETVSSDIDILIVIKESKERFIDRALRFRDFFDGIGLGVDLFVYTQEEVENGGIPLADTALKEGKVLFNR